MLQFLEIKKRTMPRCREKKKKRFGSTNSFLGEAVRGRERNKRKERRGGLGGNQSVNAAHRREFSADQKRNRP